MGAGDDVIQLASAGSEFSLALGALTVFDATTGVGDQLYTDTTFASNSEVYPDYVFAFNAASLPDSDATLLACTVSQNGDGTCPLTCTGNGGSDFYTCGETENVEIGDTDDGGDCGNFVATIEISAYVVSLDAL